MTSVRRHLLSTAAMLVVLTAVMVTVTLRVAAASPWPLNASQLVLPCIVHYALPGRAYDRVYVEIDRPPNGECDLDLRAQLSRPDPHAPIGTKVTP